MFEEQYIGPRDAVDKIAERIRALGHPATGSFAEFSSVTTIHKGDARVEAIEMVP
jgi:starvation-inducible DNA-binding protein